MNKRRAVDHKSVGNSPEYYNRRFAALVVSHYLYSMVHYSSLLEYEVLHWTYELDAVDQLNSEFVDSENSFITRKRKTKPWTWISVCRIKIEGRAENQQERIRLTMKE